MQERNDTTLAERVDADLAAPPNAAANRLSCSGALMRILLDAIIGAARTDPEVWTVTLAEDVIATLDGLATMAAQEADRLRDFRDGRCG